RITKKLKAAADHVIDTSNYKGNELRDRLMEIYNIDSENGFFEIKVVSFGFKHGIPSDADMVFDVRCFPNPFYVPELKKKTGNDKDVSDYVMSVPSAEKFYDKLADLVRYMIPLFIEEGRHSLIIAIGCTGGHHRSVTFANRLQKMLADEGHKANVIHRDIEI
ncbi:MAG: RNase adaptor protein RapZ, partial [Clostridia bacterium]|nr:RNase adaptor protein RapZ [Clostridia bacterium]